MKISLQNPENTNLHGGPAVFTARLREALDARGLYDEEGYGTWMNLAFRPVPEEVLARRPRLVIRFDGTWNMAAWPFWGCHPGRWAPLNTTVYRRLNRTLLENIERADAFVFQSDFSREMVRRLVGNMPEKPSATIFNGVDLTRFHPAEDEWSGAEIRILISHKHWAVKRSWMAPRIVAALKARTDLPIKVRVLGGDTANPLPGVPSPLGKLVREAERWGVGAEFELVGHVPPAELPEQYRWADFMLNLSFADPCPNVVVEALASGLPVVAPASGGLAELVGMPAWSVDSGEDPHRLYNPYVYRTFPDIDVPAYVDVIAELLEDLPAARSAARRRAEETLDINDVVEAYVAVLIGEGK